MSHVPLLLMSSAALALCLSCGGGDAGDEDSGPAVSEAAMAEAVTYFETVCTVCHGAVGKGDGPGSAGLDPQPRDLTDKAWQDSVNDQYIYDIIIRGGAAVGRSPVMPANPQLKSKPEVVQGLVAKVRSLEGK